MGNEQRLRPHERPGAATQVETELQFGNPPVALDGRTGVALDRQAFVFEGPDGQVFEHGDRFGTEHRRKDRAADSSFARDR